MDSMLCLEFTNQHRGGLISGPSGIAKAKRLIVTMFSSAPSREGAGNHTSPTKHQQHMSHSMTSGLVIDLRLSMKFKPSISDLAFVTYLDSLLVFGEESLGSFCRILVLDGKLRH